MKYLLIIRHAKTEHKGYEKDFERELTDRGVDDCKILSDRLKKIGFVPDLVILSPAKRTLQTAKHLAKHLDWNKDKIVSIDKLYLAFYEVILSEIANTDNSINSLAVIGHNPGITDLINFIDDVFTTNIPTCGMALFKFDIKDWKDIVFHNRKERID